MKICICTNGRPHEGGVNSFIKLMCDSLELMGHQTNVITLFGISKYRKARNAFVDKTDTFLKNSPWKTFIVYNLSKLILCFWLTFYYVFKKWDIIFAQDVSVVNASRLVRFLFKIPVVLMIHGSMTLALVHQDKIEKEGFIWRFMINEEKKAYQTAQAIISNSDYSTKKYVLSVSSGVKNISVIRSLIDERMIYRDPEIRKTQREKLKISPNAFVILFVGRLTELKGGIYLLLALKQLASEENIILIYAGDGPEKPKLLECVEKHGLEDKVKILGNIPYDRINQVYNIADVLVVPSITIGDSQEPMGMVALEGMAVQIPIIVSNIGGLVELVKDGYNGFRVPEKNPDALAQAILKIKNNPSLAKTLSSNGAEEIKKNYTMKAGAQKFIKVFQDVLSK